MRPIQFPYLLALACLLAALILSHGVGGHFLFDSQAAISKNPAMAAVDGSLDSLRSAALSSNSGPLGRPVAMFSLALNQLIAAPGEAAGFRYGNILVHVLIGVLLYHFSLTVLSGSPLLSLSREQAAGVALLAAALWLLQPLAVSTVLYVVQRMAQLATLFTVLGLCVYVHYRSAWARRAPGVGELLVASAWLLLLTTLAAFSKENGLLLPWALVAVEFCFFAGYWGGRELPALDRLGWAALAAPIVLLSCLLLVNPGVVMDAYEHRAFTLEERLLTQARVLWQYLAWMLSPMGSGVGLHHDDFPLSRGWLEPASTALALLAWGVALGLALALRRRAPVPAFALLFYLITQSMESGVLALEMVYEHRTYLPGTAIALAVAWGAHALCLRYSPNSFALLGVLMAASFALASWSRAGAWSDELLFSYLAREERPQSLRSQYHAANTSLRRAEGMPAGALRERLLGEARKGYLRMHAMDAGNFTAPITLIYMAGRHGLGQQETERWLAALEEAALTRAIQGEDLNAVALLVRCQLAGTCGLPPDWLDAFLDLLKLRTPQTAFLDLQRARLLAIRADGLVAAEQAYADAIATAPGYAAAYFGLAALLDAQGRSGEAVEVLRRLGGADARRRHSTRLAAALDGAQ